jgi:FKBP-type peptidyl-prolyl cis-trans isomerase 2
MEEGLTGLEAGEETTLAIPPEKAYGERSEEKSRSTRPTT